MRSFSRLDGSAICARQSGSTPAELEVREDGGVRVYDGRASDQLREVGYPLLGAIVGEVAAVIETARMVSADAGFRGAWGFGDEVAEVEAVTLHEPGSPALEALIGRLVRATKGSSLDISALDPFAVPTLSLSEFEGLT